jgi:hypothetical protein
MMNWKGFGRKWWWPNFKVLFWQHKFCFYVIRYLLYVSGNSEFFIVKIVL